MRPFYLFICASLSVSSHTIMRYLTANDRRLGVGAVFLFDRIEDLPKESFYIVDLSTKPYQVYEQELASEKKSFSLDYLAPEQYERYARLMAPIRIDVEGGKVGLPTSISFLQGYQAQRPQMLGLEKVLAQCYARARNGSPNWCTGDRRDIPIRYSRKTSRTSWLDCRHDRVWKIGNGTVLDSLYGCTLPAGSSVVCFDRFQGDRIAVAAQKSASSGWQHF